MASDHLFLRITGVLYLGLMTNVLVVLSALPFVVVLLTLNPATSWPFLAATLVLAAPGIAAAFGVFLNHTETGDNSVVRTFVAAWRRYAKRSIVISAVTITGAVVLAVDIAWASQLSRDGVSQLGAVVIPVFATLLALLVVAGVGCLVALVERPDATTWKLAKASLYLLLRRWYLTLASVVCVGALFGIVATRPAIGLGIVLTPMLYLVWANTRYTLRPIVVTAKGPFDGHPN